MSLYNWLPALIVLSSLVPGLAIFLLREESHALRTLLNLLGAVTKLLLVGVMIWGVFHERIYETRWTLAPGLDLVLNADALSVLFVTLSTVLWLVTTIYAIGYLEHSPHRSRFFGFFSLCVTATVGLALAGNLLTFVIFYELLTLATYPLVAHKGTPEAVRGARIYLTYTLGGGMLLLVGAVWLQTLAGPLEFAQGGILADIPGLDPATLSGIFLLLIAGLGVKAALVPFHGWLPQAMVAPAPVSALLAFTIGAIGMIGIPPVAGFVSKWFIGLGAVEAGAAAWVLPVLVASSLLNAAYFLPILYRAWFKAPPADWPTEAESPGRFETAGALLWPPVVTAVLALAAGLFAAAPYSPLEWAELIAEREYRLFFLLAMAGNFALIVGQDLITFYLGFALMGLAAYGLVVHEGNERVRRAGRAYLVMTLIGEVALFAAFLFLYARTGTLTPTMEQVAGAASAELGLLLLAFGIKAGLIGLHLWLPLAHPAAPIAASAVLSGAMIKAALVGWLRYLPLGQQSLPELGILLVVVGAASALLAVPVALVQRDPKVVLAYSSIAKMGTMIAGLGIAVMEPELAPAMMAALVFYAAPHGLAKGALFLGVGVVKASTGRWPLAVLLLVALVLAAAPLTSGALAKDLLKQALLVAPSEWALRLTWILPVTAAGTALVMGRFLYLMQRMAGSAAPAGAGSALPWLGLAAASLALPLVFGTVTFNLSGVWPILVAAVLSAAVLLTGPAWLGRWVGRIPPGDILEPLVRALRRLGDFCQRMVQPDRLFARLPGRASSHIVVLCSYFRKAG